jgi:hypothetical protein
MRKATAYKGMPTAQVRSQSLWALGITARADRHLSSSPFRVAVRNVGWRSFRCYVNGAFDCDHIDRSHHAPLQQLRLGLQEVFNGSHDKIATLFTAIIRAFVLRDARLHPPARLRPPARTPSAIADAPFGDVRPMDRAR